MGAFLHAPTGYALEGEARVRAGRTRRFAARGTVRGGAAVPGPAAPLRRGHVGVVRGDDRRAERPARRRAQRRRQHQRPDLDHEHRRLHVERAGGRAAADHRPPRDGRPAPQDAGDARAHGAPRAQRPVLQLVRPPHGSEADDLAADRRGARADPLLGRQRLAGGRPARRREPRPGAAGAGAATVRLDGLRLLLPARGQPDPLPLRAAAPARRPAATTRSSRRAASRATSASRRASSRSAITTARSARSPTTATSRRSPSASRAPISASRSSRARSPTTARASRRRGAGACSRR